MSFLGSVFRVLGFRALGHSRVEGLGFGLGFQGFRVFKDRVEGLRVQGFRVVPGFSCFRVPGFRFSRLGFRVSGFSSLGFRVSGFRVSGLLRFQGVG